jgi:hypothetical protein
MDSALLKKKGNSPQQRCEGRRNHLNAGKYCGGGYQWDTAKKNKKATLHKAKKGPERVGCE